MQKLNNVLATYAGNRILFKQICSELYIKMFQIECLDANTLIQFEFFFLCWIPYAALGTTDVTSFSESTCSYNGILWFIWPLASILSSSRLLDELLYKYDNFKG